MRNCIRQNYHSYKVERGLWGETNEVEWTGKVEIRVRMEFLAVGEACVAIF